MEANKEGTDVELSDWSESELKEIVEWEKAVGSTLESIQPSTPGTDNTQVDSDDSDDVPLLRITKNKKLLKRYQNDSTESHYNLRAKTPKTYRSGNNILDSDTDTNYTPSSNNSASESELDSHVEKNKSKQKLNCKRIKKKISRERGWKRIKRHVKERGPKRRRISFRQDKTCNKNTHQSGPWEIPTNTKSISTSNLQERTKLAATMKKSYQMEIIRKNLLRYHTSRLDNLLTSNGLKRKSIYPDGNCFLNAVLLQIRTQANSPVLDTSSLRILLVNHLNGFKEHYLGFLSFPAGTEQLEKERTYNEYLNDLRQNGHWNSDLADCMPLAIANMFQQDVRVYSSKIENPVYDIKPDLFQAQSQETIKLALLSVSGNEHYDGIVPFDNDTAQKANLPKDKQTEPVQLTSETPNNISHERSDTDKERGLSHCVSSENPSPAVTPRKRADYNSPVKKQLSRKKQRNPDNWLRNKRKYCRNHGLEYTGRTGKQAKNKSMKYLNHEKCRFKCSLKLSEEAGNEIFKTYWELGCYEKQRNFICQNVEQTPSKRYSSKRKENSRSFYLPCGETKVRVCKQFFLGILDIGKKTVEFALKQKRHGVFVGKDQRGKKPSANKTPLSDKNFIREHIKSFPTVSSHYTRKDSKRKYLDEKLSINKIYDLYQEKCQQVQRGCKSKYTYRKIFCNEFNLSFHKPKKDQCAQCVVYNEAKESGEVSDELERKFQEHWDMKEQSREAKRLDKERAVKEKAVVGCTFDLQAVLPTPCSKIGDVYYKRCLSTYNLSVYNIGDHSGTCYMWDETEGGRGSSEIGTCLLLYINSVTTKSHQVKEITFYSDTCSGQNRNQYVSSALLHAVTESQSLEKINHKFFERGHSEMESDSIHSAVEYAKKNTKIYVPDQWDTIVSMARKRNPYVVIPLKYSDFYDLKDLKKETCKNMKNAENGSKVNWMKVKWIQFLKSNPDSIFINYTYEMINFMEIKVRNTSTRGRPGKTLRLKNLYNKKLPVSQAKKSDLLSLCSSNIIPEKYHAFYKELPTAKSVPDKLSEPDVEEEDCDTDVDEN